MDKDVIEFKQAIKETFSDMNPKTYWPLNGGQINAYFDIELALNIYFKIIELKKTKTIKEIAELMPSADIIRIGMEDYLILGLKLANKLNIYKISKDLILDYFHLLCDILRVKVKSNIFCLDGKNILFSDDEINGILEKTNFDIPLDNKEKTKIAYLSVTTNNLCYSQFYDIMQTGGFYMHGPYDVSNKFGDDTILLIRDYHNINLKEIWPEFNLSYKKLRILCVYKDLDLKLSFSNHPNSSTSVGDKLIAYKIYLDDNELPKEKIDDLTKELVFETQKQVNRVNAISDLDKVRKGAEIGFIQYKKLFEYFREEPKPKYVEQLIAEDGDKFITKYKLDVQMPVEYYVNVFDPSSDDFEV